MINGKQIKDLSIFCLARSIRFVLGWYWLPSQKANLMKAEAMALKAYKQHGGNNA